MKKAENAAETKLVIEEQCLYFIQQECVMQGSNPNLGRSPGAL
jgi:hypothetical protein